VCYTHTHTHTASHDAGQREPSRGAYERRNAERRTFCYTKAEGRRPKAEGRRPKAEGRRPKAEGRRLKAKANIPKGTDCTNHSYRQYFFMFYFSRFDGGRSSHSERCMPTGHAHLARADREKKKLFIARPPPCILERTAPHRALNPQTVRVCNISRVLACNRFDHYRQITAKIAMARLQIPQSTPHC
jgi:hypothetical protein